MVQTSDAEVASAAEGVVEAILACEISEINLEKIRKIFTSVTSLRLCLTAISDANVFLSSNLLLRGDVVFTPVVAASSCAWWGRPAFLAGENAIDFSDLSLVVRQDGVQALFVVPLPTAAKTSVAQSSRNPPEGAASYFGVLVIGSPTETDIVEGDLRAALLLTRDIATDHRSPLEKLIASIAPIFSNTSTHPQWGDAGGLVRTAQTSGGTSGDLTDGTTGSRPEESQTLDDVDGDEDYAAQDEFGSIILSPVQYEILDAASPWTLEFLERVLEVQYRRWRGERMVTVDIMAFVVLLAYHATRDQSSHDDDLSCNGRLIFLGRSVLEWFPCVMVAIPLVLAAVPRTQECYARRRDFLMGSLYVILVCHHLLVGPCMATRLRAREYPLDVAPPALSAMETAMQLLASLDGVWMSVLSIILHVRHPWQLSMMVTAIGISLALAPPLCPTGAVPWACWAAIATRIAVLQLIIPAIILYILEHGARKAFCATPFASAWVWRAELQRFPS